MRLASSPLGVDAQFGFPSVFKVLATSPTRSPFNQIPLAEPRSFTRISPLILLISACFPDIELSLTAISHWSDRPMVTVIDRIGKAFSTPLGPLTMKLADTPSRSAGL